MSCSDTSPIMYPTGSTATLYYTSSGTCKDSGGNAVGTVRFVISNSAVTSVTIDFIPETSSLDIPTESFTKCSGEGTGNHSRDSYISERFQLTFPVPPVGDNTWGWDFGEDDLPPKLEIKVRVRRP